MGLKLLTPASDQLVSLDEAKLACRIDSTVGSVQDSQLTRKIASFTSQIEAFVGRSLMEQVWQLSLDSFADEIELPAGPVTSIDAIVFDDADGVETELDASLYLLDLVSDPQRIVRASDATWPDTFDGINAVRITYTSGFDGESPLLTRLKDVCLDMLAVWYDDRTAAEFPKWAKDRLRDLRLPVI